ncbi:hypothetical protein [Streptomyces sp. 891-h]|uniref:hypothetical protein n=1 Tax=unclassified Streptomyces TaxID=2593676 RepID=UPI001FA9E9E9|nr:hypothetical protein [Streptomyces sp. 891-h]UNZ16244.1 hypothetical protein HC362_03260 [Streptomyces sp. 891-h]
MVLLKPGKSLSTATAALALGTGLVVTGPATEAQAVSAICAQTSGNRAGVCFYSGAPEKITLWDNACDGHRVYADYVVQTRAQWKPATKCKHHYTGNLPNDYPPGVSVKVRVCIEDWGPNTCSRWAYGRTS